MRVEERMLVPEGGEPVVPEPWLDALAGALGTLRGRASGVAFGPLASLAGRLPAGSALTLDFAASRRLGAPLVLWRPPVDPAAADAVITQPAPLRPGLTRREQDVAACLLGGASNKAIARRLGIGLGTVKDHVHSILRKSGCASRAAFVAAHAVRVSAGEAGAL